MKKTFLILGSVFLLFSCYKKENTQNKPKFNDNLLVVKDNDVNILIRKYNQFEKDYVKAFKEDDRGLLQIYSDSANHYDYLLFDRQTVKNLDKKELMLFYKQINKIRTEKIKSLSPDNK